jgi:hypothetical protein
MKMLVIAPKLDESLISRLVEHCRCQSAQAENYSMVEATESQNLGVPV